MIVLWWGAHPSGVVDRVCPGESREPEHGDPYPLPVPMPLTVGGSGFCALGQGLCLAGRGEGWGGALS